MSSSQLQFVLIFAWIDSSFVDTFLISFWFFPQILDTFVTWSLFFLHSTFKLSKRLLTPCILPSSSVTFALHVFTSFSTITRRLVIDVSTFFKPSNWAKPFSTRYSLLSIVETKLRIEVNITETSFESESWIISLLCSIRLLVSVKDMMCIGVLHLHKQIWFIEVQSPTSLIDSLIRYVYYGLSELFSCIWYALF